MPDGRHIENDHYSAAGCPIFAKFCKNTQNPRVMAIECEKFKTLKFKMATAIFRMVVSPYFSEISPAFDEILYTEEAKCTYFRNPKIRDGWPMPYWKIIFCYNTTTDSSIWATFCTKTQNPTTTNVKHLEFRKFSTADGFAPKRYWRTCYNLLLVATAYRLAWSLVHIELSIS